MRRVHCRLPAPFSSLLHIPLSQSKLLLRFHFIQFPYMKLHLSQCMLYGIVSTLALFTQLIVFYCQPFLVVIHTMMYKHKPGNSSGEELRPTLSYQIGRGQRSQEVGKWAQSLLIRIGAVPRSPGNHLTPRVNYAHRWRL